jgi:hypothetical protein
VSVSIPLTITQAGELKDNHTRCQSGRVERLKAQGDQVRGVARKAGLSIDDAAALKGTLSGVDGAFLLIPFDTKAPGSAQAENEMKPAYGWIIECHDEARGRDDHPKGPCDPAPDQPHRGTPAFPPVHDRQTSLSLTSIESANARPFGPLAVPPCRFHRLPRTRGRGIRRATGPWRDRGERSSRSPRRRVEHSI